MAETNGTTNGHAGDDLANRKYIRWDAEGVEKKPPNEDEDIQAVADMINGIQRAQYNCHRHCFGGTHARTHGIVKGKFIVSDDLPKHLKQTELFAKGGEYPVIARYSTEPGDPGLDDHIPLPRGFALKIFGVQGDMFDAGKDFPTQDIEFNSCPVIDLADAKTTKEIIALRVQYGHDPELLRSHLKKRDDFELQTGRDKVRTTHLESLRQYGQSAYRFGDYVMKYALVPDSETQKKLWDETIRPEDESDILHRWLQNFHREYEAQYSFQVQLLENLEDQPVEYSGKLWDDQKYPWQTVAKVVFPKQESFDYGLKVFWEDRIRVDPWQGLKGLQPLGGTNRLRRVVYPASSKLRRKMNAVTEVNVRTMDEIPV